MGTTLATKTDLLVLKQELKQDLALLKQDIQALRTGVHQELSMVGKDMELLRTSMTVRLGSIQVVSVTLLFAALKLT